MIKTPNETKKQARIAGLLYLLASLTAPFPLIYVPRTLIALGDATATANQIRASETLFRLGITSELFGFIMFIFVSLALYRLFKAVDKKHALSLFLSTAFSFSSKDVFVNCSMQSVAHIGRNRCLDAPRIHCLNFVRGFFKGRHYFAQAEEKFQK